MFWSDGATEKNCFLTRANATKPLKAAHWFFVWQLWPRERIRIRNFAVWLARTDSRERKDPNFMHFSEKKNRQVSRRPCEKPSVVWVKFVDSFVGASRVFLGKNEIQPQGWEWGEDPVILFYWERRPVVSGRTPCDPPRNHRRIYSQNQRWSPGQTLCAYQWSHSAHRIVDWSHRIHLQVCVHLTPNRIPVPQILKHQDVSADRSCSECPRSHQHWCFRHTKRNQQTTRPSCNYECWPWNVRVSSYDLTDIECYWRSFVS